MENRAQMVRILIKGLTYFSCSGEQGQPGEPGVVKEGSPVQGPPGEPGRIYN